MIKINSKAKSMKEMGVDVACGFTMTFANGNTISVQFGLGNYGSNKHESKNETELAEIAMWNKKGVWHKFENGEEVKGWNTTDEIAYWIHFASVNEWRQDDKVKQHIFKL